MSYSNRQWAFLKDVSLLINFIAKSGWKATGGDLYRSNPEQERLFNMGRSNARPGESRHGSRMAIDLNFWDSDGAYMGIQLDILGRDKHQEKMQFIGDYWKSLHPKNKWGGEFKSLYDYGHFERGD